METFQTDSGHPLRCSVECMLAAAACGGLVGLTIGPVATLLCAAGAAWTHWWLIRRASLRRAA
jgi:hypothetical protein